MNKKVFYLINGKVVTEVGKSGSTSVAAVAYISTHPEAKVNGQSLKDNPELLGHVYHALAPKTDDPGEAPVLLVRNPINRFLSAVNEDGITDIDQHLTHLEAGTYVSDTKHFAPTSKFVSDKNTLFKFPEHIEELSNYLGVKSIPHLNDSSNALELTSEQLARVQAIYADDIALYESITEAGQIHTPPALATDEDKGIKRQEIAASRYEAETAGFDLNGMHVRTDRQTQATLTSALVFASQDPDLTVDWKLENGTFVTLNSAEIIAMAQAVMNHVQAQFAKEKNLLASVEAVSTEEELNAIIWS